MTTALHAGIDVSMDSLDVTILFQDDSTEHFVVGNDPKGFRTLWARLKKLGRDVHLCLEATSTYHWKLCDALYGKPGLTVFVANTKSAKDFIRSHNTRGKTDKMDSAGLAHYVRAMKLLPWHPPRENVKELRSYARRVHQVTKDRKATRNRLHAMKKGGASKALQKEIKMSIEANNAELERLRRHMEKIIRSDEELEEWYRLLLTIKGVGRISALSILAEIAYFPEGLNKNQWVANAGMDPQPFESGTSVKGRNRPSKRGNARLRLALFMPALVGVRRCREIREYYERKCGEGRAKLSALFCVMRKLLLAIWGMLHSKSEWNPSLFNGAKS